MYYILLYTTYYILYTVICYILYYTILHHTILEVHGHEARAFRKGLDPDGAPRSKATR